MQMKTAELYDFTETTNRKLVNISIINDDDDDNLSYGLIREEAI